MLITKNLAFEYAAAKPMQFPDMDLKRGEQGLLREGHGPSRAVRLYAS